MRILLPLACAIAFGSIASATPSRFQSFLRSCESLLTTRDEGSRPSSLAPDLAREEIRQLQTQLSQRVRHDELTVSEREHLLSQLTIETRSGYLVSQPDGNSDAYELAEKLVPLRPFRTLLGYINWTQRQHGEPLRFGRQKPPVLNLIGGEVRNTRPSDYFAVSVIQIPHHKRVYMDLIIGPFEDATEPPPRLTWGEGSETELQWIHFNDRHYIWLRRLDLRRENLSLYEDLIRSVQDLYFDKID